jgi:pimeloyl-ACP methyl ester carboxylesterase
MRKLMILVVLVALVVGVGPFFAAQQFDWGPGAEVRAKPGQPVEIAEGRILNVHDRGEGPPIILIHGWASNAADWDRVPELLAARGHRVISYDRAGYGYSTRKRSSEGNFSIASNARDLVQLMDAMGIDRAALAGWSFGGGVAQRVAIDHPDRVSHVALIASVGPDTDDAPPEPDDLLDSILRSPIAVPVLDWVVHVPAIAFEVTERNVAEAFSGQRNVPTGWTIYTQAMLAIPGTSNAIAGEIQSGEDVPDPALIEQPVLILHGSDDALVPFRVAEALHASAPRSALEAVVGGSHMLPVTHPEWIADHIHVLVGSEYRQGQLPAPEPQI